MNVPDKQTLAREWLESNDNLRPLTKTSRSKPKGFRYRVRIQEDERPLTATPQPPRTRLRLEEAFQNASRARETHVFTKTELTEARTKWTKPIRHPGLDERSDKITVANLMKPTTMSVTTDQLSRIKLRGEESANNRARGQGSLTLKTISLAESDEALRQQVHVRCAGGEAHDNRECGQHGTGVSSLLGSTQNRETLSAAQSNGRAVRTDEAAENWRRDRLKEYTEMEHVLNHGWPSSNSGVATNSVKSRPTTASSYGCLTTCPPWGNLNQGQLIGDRPKTTSRCVSQAGAMYALREGSAMADRMGLAQSNRSHFSNVDPPEMEEILGNSIRSSDEHPVRQGPKVRLEGLEYAMKGRGTLTAGLIPMTCAQSEAAVAPRLKGCAYEIAAANKGDASKLLMSNWRLPPEQRPLVKPIPNSRNIRGRSRGMEARNCLNPTRPKWSGKIHWKRRPPASVHGTF